VANAAIANTSTTLNQVGIREDLEDIIYRVAPEETPFTSNIGTATATNVKHDWQTETLAAPSAANAAYEGGDISTFQAPNVPTRLENICQIFTKTALVSGTDDAVISAGRDDEMDRQKVLRGIENKRDIEAACTVNYGSNAETAGTIPRRMAGCLAWGQTNTSVGTGGSNGGWNGSTVTAATNGTQRSFSESIVKAGMASVFAAGGKPSQAYMGGSLKQEFSSFTGIAEIRTEAAGGKMATIYGAADAYLSDFGMLMLIPHQYSFARDCIIIDPEMWAVATLRGQEAVPLAKTGDADKFLITAEKTLVSRNEAASVFLRDLQ